MLEKNLFGEKFSLKKSFVRGKIFFVGEKIFFEKKFSDNRQKVQESDEIDKNLANKVTN